MGYSLHSSLASPKPVQIHALRTTGTQYKHLSILSPSCTCCLVFIRSTKKESQGKTWEDLHQMQSMNPDNLSLKENTYETLVGPQTADHSQDFEVRWF